MSLVRYLKATQGELKHVSWPTQKQTVYFTIMVIGVSFLTAAFLGAFDVLFQKVLEYII